MSLRYPVENASGTTYPHYGNPFGIIRNLGGMKVGARIRALRKAAGLKQGALANAAGMPQSTLSDIERGDIEMPGGDVLVRIAQALKVSPDALVADGEDPVPALTTLDESELLAIYRVLTDASRGALLAAARAMQDAQPDALSPPGSRTATKRRPDA